MKNYPLNLLFFLLPTLVFSQSDNGHDTLEIALSVTDLSPVTVTAFRLEEVETQVPLAISRIGNFRLQTGEQQLTLNDALSSLPGVYVQNEENFAQDLRVSIRGFGARSSFGIRGVKLLMDGFPETTPDGQGQVDNIDPGSVHGVEAIRGSTAGLYGNASGGYLNFSTLQFNEKKYLETGFRFSSFSTQRYQVAAGGKAKHFFYDLHSSHLRREGYRAQSEAEATLFNGGMLFPIDSTAELMVCLNFVDSPKAEDPGALSKDEAEDDPKQAGSEDNILYDTGEKVTQGRLGILFTKKISPANTLKIRGFHTMRLFENRLLGFIGDLDRTFSGLHLTLERNGKIFGLPWQTTLGTELESQTDRRKRHRYSGVEKGPVFDARTEEYLDLAGFWLNKFSFGKRAHLHAGLRFDYIEMGLENTFAELTQRIDATENRVFRTLNPIFGMTFNLAKNSSLYANFSTAFETPTLIEASTYLNFTLNPDLSPQRAKSFELGFKSWQNEGKSRSDVAVFFIKSKDEIVLVQQFENYTSYENFSHTNRFGIELSHDHRLWKDSYGYFGYTLSVFQFEEISEGPYVKYLGNKLPGIPKHIFWAEIRKQPSTGLFASAKMKVTGPQFADNDNLVEIGPTFLVNLRIGGTWEKNGTRAEVFAGINNALNRKYFSNIRINDSNENYYEPAPHLHLVGGMTFRFGG